MHLLPYSVDVFFLAAVSIVNFLSFLKLSRCVGINTS